MRLQRFWCTVTLQLTDSDLPRAADIRARSLRQLLDRFPVLAHCPKRPSLFKPRPYNQQYIRAEAIRIASAVSQDEEGDGSTPPWTTHESRFMRIAYHLQYRAQRLGWDIEPNEVYSPERFGMSKATQYALALEEEAKTLLAASFRQICGLPAPPAFKALYERDQTRWYKSRPERSRYESDIVT